ncbi:MAG: hypothetical protein LBE35_01275 [Clostridiales bacterium]|nr:hypothetical protein [Clostridiales bacterium]
MGSNGNHAWGGINFGDMLTIAFIVLRLTEAISWSWWWILSPLWIQIVASIVWSICKEIKHRKRYK